MRRAIRSRANLLAILFALMFAMGAMLVADAAVAAGGAADFYTNLLRRGAADLASGRYEPAIKELRIASFGLVDSLPEFETAHVYLAIAAKKLNRETDARLAALRVVAAERIERHYASLPLSQEFRTEFDALARKLLPADQVSFLYSAAAQTSRDPAPAPVPAPQPPPRVAPVPVPPPATTDPVVSAPQETPPAPAPVPVPKSTKPPVERKPQPAKPPKPQPDKPVATVDVSRQLVNAETALARNDLGGARTIYRQVLEAPALDHDTAIRLAEGLYRARDFANALRAFGRAGALRPGEEPYHYYKAVALYESGRYAEAKRELAAALPFIDETPDVARYRAKIDGAID